jgi:hypothetical protein
MYDFIPVTSVVHGYIVFEPSAYMNSSGANFRQTAKGITCQRVSAWQCCMGGVSFLWEMVNFGPRQNKNHPTDQDQIWQA